MSKAILITGASGSIGQKLRKHLNSMDFGLRLLCLNPRRDPAVTTTNLGIYADAWAEQFAGVDTVIHLAGNPFATASWASAQLNFDMTLNVLRAAEAYGTRRVVFASSNWVMAGYRFETAKVTTDIPPWPINAYGSAKLLCERAGRQFAERCAISFIALRVGYCQHSEGNQPGPHMQNGVWGQQMWLSDRDLCQGFEKAVIAESVPFAVLNLMSNNPGMRWDIEQTRQVIGYEPRDGHVAVSTPEIEELERLARLDREVIDRLDQLTAKW